MRPLALIMLGAGAALISTAAFAAPQPLHTMRLLADLNNDGKVTPAEYQKSRRDFIMKADRDKDGKVSRTEWDNAATMERNQARFDGVEGAEKIGYGGWFDMIDANKDHMATPAEMDVMTGARFHRMDLNGDGIVDRVEGKRLREVAQSKVRP